MMTALEQIKHKYATAKRNVARMSQTNATYYGGHKIPNADRLYFLRVNTDYMRQIESAFPELISSEQEPATC